MYERFVTIERTLKGDMNEIFTTRMTVFSYLQEPLSFFIPIYAYTIEGI